MAPGNGATLVLPADLYGDGRVGFAWMGSQTREYSTGYRFLRLDPGRKPYLLTAIDNGMGGRFEITYSTSTAMRLADQAEGRAWVGELPMAVQVVGEIREVDTVTGRETRMAIRYHDGVYDGPQREFRGFREVTVEMGGDASIPTSRQVISFFQGDPEHPNAVERESQRVLAGAVLATETYEKVNDNFELRQSSA